MKGSKITAVTIPESITKIGNNAFYGCSGLKSVTIPENVDTIGGQAFAGCVGITELTWNAIYCDSNGNMPTSNIEAVTIGDKVKILPDRFLSESKISAVTLPESLITIGTLAFFYCVNLSSVNIPQSVVDIGNGAFYGCSGLMSIVIPDSVTVICNEAFYGCKNLTNVVIGKSVTSIGVGAFADCTNLTNVVIPESVTDIGRTAFAGCSGLTSVTIGNAVDYIGDDAFNECTNLTELVIGKSVTTIGIGAFSDCSSLTNVTIPNSVTYIGNCAFSNCNGLTCITIPDSVSSVGDFAFSNCHGLTNVSWNAKTCNDFISAHAPFGGSTNIKSFAFGNGVEHIPAYLCYGLTGLTSVTIGKAVSSMGEGAFLKCGNLSNIGIARSNSTYDSRKGCNAIIETATNKLLVGCKTTLIPNDVDTIAKRAFYQCPELTHIHVPNSVASIGEEAFAGCQDLQSIRIGTSLDEIGNYAFACPNLNAIYNARPRPAAIEQVVFDGVNRNTCVLYVPKGYEQVYWANADWNRFKIIMEWEPDGDPQDFEIGDVNSDGIVSGADVTALYNVLLNADEFDGNTDVNEDGVINGSDVTALYTLLLQ